MTRTKSIFLWAFSLALICAGVLWVIDRNGKEAETDPEVFAKTPEFPEIRTNKGGSERNPRPPVYPGHLPQTNNPGHLPQTNQKVSSVKLPSVNTNQTLFNEDYKPRHEPVSGFNKKEFLEKNKSVYISFEYGLRFDEADVPLLKEMYMKETLTNRVAAARMLAYLGADEGVALLTNSLTNEFKHKNISQEEESVLRIFMGNLGLAGRVSDEAFEFVANAIFPSFWQNHRGWRTENEKYKNELMVGEAIKALGYSGRTKGVSTIRQLVNSDEYIPRFSGGIETAAFNYYLIGKYGDDRLTEFVGLQKIYSAYLEWKAEYAQQWMEKLGLPYEE